jgi:hypothetical protein
MLSFLMSLLGLLPGAFTTINGITNAISNEKIAALNATTAQDQIVANEKVATLEAQRDLMISDSQHSSLDIWMRTMVAIGPATYLCKIFLWDKVLQEWTHGTTDPLDPNLWQVVMVVLGFYFLYAGAIGVTRILKA